MEVKEDDQSIFPLLFEFDDEVFEPLDLWD